MLRHILVIVACHNKDSIVAREGIEIFDNDFTRSWTLHGQMHSATRKDNLNKHNIKCTNIRDK